jgi:hypothetical protein
MKFIIPVITRTSDNGDGGYTTYAYNTKDELIADHPKSKDFEIVDGEYKEIPIKLSKQEINQISRYVIDG